MYYIIIKTALIGSIKGENDIMALTDITIPLNISAIRWRILVIIYEIIYFLAVTHTHTHTHTHKY